MIVCEVSTRFGLFVLMTVLQEHDGFPAPKDRLLLVSNHSSAPEANDALLEFARSNPHVKAAFPKIVSLNELLFPLHPTQWQRPSEDLDAYATRSILEYAFHQGTNRVTAVLMESIQTPPSNTLAQVFSDCDLYVYSDGLMSYGPTRFQLPSSVGARIRGLYYMDFVPGLSPTLLREFSVQSFPVPPAALRKTIEDTIPPETNDGSLDYLNGGAVFLGQYLSGLGLCTEDEEVALYAKALSMCAFVNEQDYAVFKPHPNFSSGLLHDLEHHPLLKNCKLQILPKDKIMEEYLLTHKPALICSVFSTGLATANQIFGIKAFKFETSAFLAKLSPYENSNRVPAALISLVYPDIWDRHWTQETPLEKLQAEVDLLASSMQPKLLIKSEADKQSLLASAPENPPYAIELAIAKIAQFAPPPSLTFEQYAIDKQSALSTELFASIEQTVEEDEIEAENNEKPLQKARRLIQEGDLEEAFLVSAAALQSTPNSALHMQIINETAATLGGLFTMRRDQLADLHANALEAPQGGTEIEKPKAEKAPLDKSESAEEKAPPVEEQSDQSTNSPSSNAD